MTITTKEINKVYSMKDTNCDCDKCKSACKYCPGWFLPKEIENVATLLELSIPDLFKTKLAVNWWVGEGKNIFLLSPAMKLAEPGTESPADPRGECIFYINDRCEIYSARPFECRKLEHGEGTEENHLRHEVVALAWRKSQQWIADLLGRVPEARTFSFLDGLFL